MTIHQKLILERFWKGILAAYERAAAQGRNVDGGIANAKEMLERIRNMETK